MTLIALTIAAALLLIALTAILNNRRFQREIDAEIDALFQAGAAGPEKPFSYDDMAGLPEPVQRYIRRCVKDGQRLICSARLKQTGHMRLSPGQRWKPFSAEQYFTIYPPAFIWRTSMRFLPLIWVAGRDRYAAGEGHMLIKLLSTIPIADARGPKIAVGAFVRCLAEMMWFPTALVNNPGLDWQAVDANTARLVGRDRGIAGALTFHFDANGDIELLTSESRYLNADDAQPTKWYVHIRRYGEFDGVRLPVEVELAWEPHTGYYTWWRGTLTNLEFNVPERY